MLSDEKLRGVSAIIFDEFHERHLYGDITLARALQIQETARPDLIIVVMSATLDVGPLRKYLEPCELLSSQGRTFPVEIDYLPKPVGDWPIWEAAVKELERLVAQHDGDALVFMPGGYEISRTVQAAQDALGSQFIVLPLHGDLPTNDQDAAVAQYDRRKVVVSTNVAETSLTIDGVRIVIDSGLRAHPALRPVSRHQHIAGRKNQPRIGGSAGRSRRPHRAGCVPALVDEARTRAATCAGIARGEAAGSLGSRLDPQGQRRE